MIIVYGGAFNPPTKAHYLISKKLIEMFKPDTFYFLPVGSKYDKPGMAAYRERFKMTTIIANMLDNAVVSEKENEDKFRGTYYVLKDFSQIDDDLYFVMGADNFDYIDKWIMADKLIAEFKFIILTRKGFDIYKLIEEKYGKHKENFFPVEVDYPISSTDFRETFDKEIVLDEIYDYIQKNNLYELYEVKNND